MYLHINLELNLSFLQAENSFDSELFIVFNPLITQNTFDLNACQTLISAYHGKYLFPVNPAKVIAFLLA